MSASLQFDESSAYAPYTRTKYILPILNSQQKHFERAYWLKTWYNLSTGWPDCHLKLFETVISLCCALFFTKQTLVDSVHFWNNLPKMASTLFQPFRAVGVVTASIPFHLKQLGKENFLTISIGKAWQVYNVKCYVIALRNCLFYIFIYLYYKSIYINWFLYVFYKYIYFMQCDKLRLVLVGTLYSLVKT